MNLLQARTELKARGFEYLSDSRLNIALNNGKNALEDVYPWPWLEVTASGAAPFTIADLKYVQSVSIPADDVVLVGVDPRDIPEFDGDTSTTGSPEVWWLDGLTTLRVYPVAVKTLSVRYVKYSPELALDTDVPLIPERYHPVWVDHAAVEAYKDSDNFDQAQLLLNDLSNRRLPAMFEVFATRNRQNPAYQATSHWNSEDW